MDRERLDAVVARTDALGRRLRTLERRDAVRALAGLARADKGDFSESKHKRASDGRFGSVAGQHAGKEEGAGQGPGKEEGAAKGGAGQPQPSPQQQKAKLAKIREGLGLEGGGSGDRFNAHDYAQSQDDPEATAEKLMETLTPEQREEVARLHEKIMQRGQTIDKHRNESGFYSKERQAVHDAILFEGRVGRNPDDPSQPMFYPGILSAEKVKAAKPAQGEKPTFTILGGRGGSGKSKFKGMVYEEENAIVLDADVIKHMIEEFEGWNANEVHEESSDILESALRSARQMGLNVVFDATMKSSGGAMEKVESFKKAGYDVEAHYMHLPRQVAAERAIQRYFSPSKKSPELRGRYVPPHVVLGNRLNEQNFDQVRQHAKRWSFHDNNVERGQEPKLIARGGYGDEDDD